MKNHWKNKGYTSQPSGGFQQNDALDYARQPTVDEFRIFTEPQQGAGYNRLSRLAIHSEALGFDGFFVSLLFYTITSRIS